MNNNKLKQILEGKNIRDVLLNESSRVVIGPSSDKKDEKRLSAAYSNKALFYKDMNVFEIYHKSDESGKLENVLHIGEKGVSEDTGDPWRIDGQETYLGYIPEEDQFISGYDIYSTDEGNTSGGVLFTFKDSKIQIIKELFFFGVGSFYSSKNGYYKKLNEKYGSGIIHIRLD